MKSAQPKPTSMRRHRSQRGATDSVTRLIRRADRAGFTLVELLMVIVIIGILVGMLAVAINPVLQTARETTVITEMKQMDLAIENFNNKYGFYPPSFSGFVKSNPPDPANAAQLLPFLNKISPNHRETSSIPGFSSGLSRLQIWWLVIGSKLDDRGSLIFWLNGLGTNKQFPITGNLPLVGGNAQFPVIFNADVSIQVSASNLSGNPVTAAIVNGDDENAFGVGTTFERDTLFDFRGEQLSSDLPTGDQAAAGIRVYNSPHGNAKGDLAYRYRNAGPNQTFYQVAPVAFHVNTDGGPVFPNPRTFQISTLGLDGQASMFASSAINKPSAQRIGTPELPTVEDLADWQKFNADNIANFAAGRLDGFNWTEAVELGGKNPL